MAERDDRGREPTLEPGPRPARAGLNPDRALWGGAGALCLAALLLRLIGLTHRGLWYDELLSANFTSHGPLDTLLTVLRFDVHPPLYYLQLSLWSAVSKADAWLALNSVLWSVLAVGALCLAAGRLHGPRVGLAAGALFAIVPPALAYSDEVRMYALISALIVWVWYALEQWRLRPSRLTTAVLVISQLCVAYAHLVGLVMLSGTVLLAGWRLWRQGRPGALRRWIALEAVVGVLALPVLALGLAHSVGHPKAPDPAALAETWTFLTAGSQGAPGAGRLALALAVAAGLALGAWRVPAIRPELACLVLAPLIAAAAISYLFKPIWLDRIFVPIAPWLALVIARLGFEPGLTPGGARIRAAAAVGLGALWLAMGLGDQLTRPKGDGYAAAAALLRGGAGPADVVVMSDPLGFWCLLRFLDGPGWGDPLHTHIPEGRWLSLTPRLPAKVQARMAPTTLKLAIPGSTAQLIGAAGSWPDPRGDLIIVSTEFSDLYSATTPPPGRVRIQTLSLPPVVLERWRRPAPAPAPGPRRTPG